MKLDHLSLEQLKLSPLNVRRKGGKDIADLLPLIRRHGIIQPLLVRPNCEGFEIIAGQRRYNSLLALAGEGIAEPVPCIIMEDGDDARAVEASLAENIGHLPMDEIDQFKAFAGLVQKGMTAADIAAHFGVTERLVHQRLAIANLIEPILNAYRREDISADTLRSLTMATQRQQKAWWKLFKSADEYAPQGRALKEWLFGGSQIPVGNALFDVASYTGAIVSDLFGEERYFADSEAFWRLQGEAIAQARDAYLEKGWAEIVILDIGQHWQGWDYVKAARTKGGKVYVTCTRDGEVAFHEGFLTAKDARKKEKAQAASPECRVERPELTQTMQNYLGLHRHAAVRTELLAHPGIALRLATAHIIAGSSLWTVRPESQRAANNAIAESLAASKAEAAFAETRTAIAALLGIESEDGGTLVSSGIYGCGYGLTDIFRALLQREDEAVMKVLSFAMAETLAAHSPVVETLGALLHTDMRAWWTPDETFLDLLRDKDAINAIVREVAGGRRAEAHTASTAKVQKKIIADSLTESRQNGGESWQPRYMAFPAAGYTARFPGRGPQDEDTEYSEAAE
ncbi:ParB/RepB/Spo0J family partition protein [Rhizorhapis sp. SPR117]|uniref:ParB/RepB/Spo0J family partition protein n=1 Tax=Rhizorhapis sp. SPR117 TaxID=2912611 RepID=UPI001F158C45|nr:ParB N-terminal domain-containing protein [Rhizorhapis sp. SPR117]